MADLKISQLTSATTPLAGTEVLPIVQSSATVKVATDDLTVKNVRSNATSGILQVVGPASAATRVMTTPDANFTVARTDAAQTFTGAQTFSTSISVGAATPASSGSGLTFPATQSAASNANTLDDYEEGTFTVAVTPASGSVVMSNSTLQYTKVGRLVTITGECNLTSVSTPSGAVTIGNLPFVNSGNSQRSSRTGFFIRAASFTGVPLGVCVGFINVSVSVIDVSAVNNFVFADIGANLQAGTAFMFSFSYMTTT